MSYSPAWKHSMKEDLESTIEELVRVLQGIYDQSSHAQIIGFCVDPYGVLRDAKEVLEISRKRKV